MWCFVWKVSDMEKAEDLEVSARCSGSVKGLGTCQEREINHMRSCPSVPPGAVYRPAPHVGKSHESGRSSRAELIQIETRCFVWYIRTHWCVLRLFKLDSETLFGVLTDLCILRLKSDACLARVCSLLRHVTDAAAESCGVGVFDTLIVHSFLFQVWISVMCAVHLSAVLSWGLEPQI